MPTSIRIIFDNPDAVFFSGQTITGHIQVICDKPKSCRGIEVEFSGYSKVHWSERKQVGSGKNRRTVTRHYSSRENFYNMKCYVWGNGSTSELPPGTHVFNFSFLLPQNIPSSFESHVGKVRHNCTAKMDIPWKFDKSCIQPYSVNTLYDLNMDQQAMMKIECNKQDYMCCLWCRSGPLSLVLRVDRSGYVPGENMTINAEISNMTKVKVNYSKAQIHQIITYYADSGHTKKEYRKVAELKHPEITAGGDDIWPNVALQIPPLPPSYLQFCKIIDIAYVFKFGVVPSGCHFNLEHEVPVIIGSIPLRQYFNIFANGPMKLPAQPGIPYQPGQPALPDYAPTGPVAPGNAPPSAPEFATPGQPPAPGPHSPSAPVFPGAQMYPEMPLPTYNECMFGVVDYTEDDSDNKNQGHGMEFAPHYVSYSLVN